MEKIRPDDSWPHESFKEYAEHSLDHDNLEVKGDDRTDNRDNDSATSPVGTDSSSLAD